jgi:hypothetical protein
MQQPHSRGGGDIVSHPSPPPTASRGGKEYDSFLRSDEPGDRSVISLLLKDDA